MKTWVLTIVALVVLAPVFMAWLAPYLSATGVVVGSTLVGLVAWSQQKKTLFERRFVADALDAMQGFHARPETASLMKRRYPMNRYMVHVTLLRDLQIFGESAQLALNSQNADTASSRFGVAKAAYRNAQASKRLVKSVQVWQALEDAHTKLVNSYPVSWRLNVARRLATEATALKTLPAKRKRWEGALEVLTQFDAPRTPDIEHLTADLVRKIQTGLDA